jgi:hypothetical protein
MRALVLPFALWIGALQVVLPGQGNTELLSSAVALASLTVLVYRLGVWRQEMVNTKHNIGAEIARYREESTEHFNRLERRFGAIERFIDAATEHRVGIERWQGRVDTTLEAIDDSLVRLDSAMPSIADHRQGAL